MWAVSQRKATKISEPPTRITQGLGSIGRITESADGKTIVFVRERWSPSIYIGARAADGTQLHSHKRLTLDENSSVPTSGVAATNVVQ